VQKEIFVPFNAVSQEQVRKSGWNENKLDPVARAAADEIENGVRDIKLMKSIQNETEAPFKDIVIGVLAKGAWSDEARASALAAKGAKNAGQDPKKAATIAKQQVLKGMTVGQAIDKTHQIMGQIDKANADRVAKGPAGGKGSLTDQDGNLTRGAQDNLNKNNWEDGSGSFQKTTATANDVHHENYNDTKMEGSELHFTKDPASDKWTAQKADSAYGTDNGKGKEINVGDKFTGDQVHNIVNAHAAGVIDHVKSGERGYNGDGT
jgi:hypothetical protein